MLLHNLSLIFASLRILTNYTVSTEFIPKLNEQVLKAADLNSDTRFADQHYHNMNSKHHNYEITTSVHKNISLMLQYTR